MEIILQPGDKKYTIEDDFDIAPPVNYSEYDAAYRIAIGMPDIEDSVYQVMSEFIGEKLVINVTVRNATHELTLEHANPLVTKNKYGTFIEFESNKVKYKMIRKETNK